MCVTYNGGPDNIAYPYLPGTDNCHIRVQFATSDGQWLTPYVNGKEGEPICCKKGQVIMDQNTIVTLGADGKPIPCPVNGTFGINGSLKGKFPHSYKQIDAVYNHFSVKAVASIPPEGSRGGAFMYKGRTMELELNKRISTHKDADGKEQEIVFKKTTSSAAPSENTGEETQSAITNLAATLVDNSGEPSQNGWDKTHVFVEVPMSEGTATSPNNVPPFLRGQEKNKTLAVKVSVVTSGEKEGDIAFERKVYIKDDDWDNPETGKKGGYRPLDDKENQAMDKLSGRDRDKFYGELFGVQIKAKTIDETKRDEHGEFASKIGESYVEKGAITQDKVVARMTDKSKPSSSPTVTSAEKFAEIDKVRKNNHKDGRGGGR
jgi:hypothetical protein